MARIAEWRLDKFSAQNLANTAWAVATVGQQDEQLFKALARMAERPLDEFSASDLCMFVWALSLRESVGTSWGLFEYVRPKVRVRVCLVTPSDLPLKSDFAKVLVC